MLEFPEISFLDLLPFILVGLAAQIVDGALGMAFGVISSTLLGSFLGVPPAQVSASVHFAEVFTTGASGLSHAWLRNIDWTLFFRIVIPGVIGGVVGVHVLTSIDAGGARPFVMAYLASIGLPLRYRAWRVPTPRISDPKFVAPLGLVGGFLDAAGGGGWGPVVTSNLLIQGGDPRRVIGTVCASEFFLTVSVSLAFIATMGLSAFTTATVGLLIGGVIAAPFGALVARHVRPRMLMFLVGGVLTVTSLFTIVRALA
ncbi:UPF0721 transmembrane protein [Polymorphobacter multimanifer]|uniref:sulfite exporter TauE/SafE family protein n=1 Tax=Polymorphobacter multimanifer TaxID=1070431 RepID=UPI00166CEAC0|nr:sulfite exporter TauE/SafE family protein [Polymorphobacter multimanifer]GGI76071.1 UPF0721 transmembrane protein [Polymorphobacter multimanifer]